jgi:hypothetical protein
MFFIFFSVCDVLHTTEQAIRFHFSIRSPKLLGEQPGDKSFAYAASNFALIGDGEPVSLAFPDYVMLVSFNLCV